MVLLLRLIGLDFHVGPSFEVVIAVDGDAADRRVMLRALGKRFLPNAVVLLRSPDRKASLTRIAPFTEAYRSVGGKTTAYVCRNFTCNAPTTDVEIMLELLK